MSVKHRVKQRLQRAVSEEVDGARGESLQLRREVKQLRRRVRDLQEDVLEARRLHERVAELTDAVAELLVPAMDRDDEKVRRAVETFNKHSA